MIPIFKANKSRASQSGFTFVEIAVIAPIIILMITAFITVIVNMTGDVLASRGSSILVYNVQDALNRIEEDVKLSTTFLAETNITAVSPQGYNNTTASFKNIGDANGPALILNALATTGNPLSSSSQVAYMRDNLAYACGAPQQSVTKPLSINIVYFVKDSSLWRRTITPATYSGTTCTPDGLTAAGPWQQGSCSPGSTGATCKTEDVRLVDGVTPGNFDVGYFASSADTTANSVASTDSSVTVRKTALQTLATASVSIKASQEVAGRTIEQSASLRATRLDTNATTIAETVVPTTPSAPANLAASTSIAATGPVAKFTWANSSGGGSMKYLVQYNINGGAWTPTTPAETTNLSYDVTAQHGQVVNLRVKASNGSGTDSAYTTYSITTPIWATVPFQNGWTDFLNGYSSAAFTKTSEGTVMLKGMVKAGTSSGENNIITLPAGYRPCERMLFYNSSWSNSGRVDIDTSGNVMFERGHNGWFSLDGINFSNASCSQYTNLTDYRNSWGWWGTVWAKPAFYMEPNSKVIHLKGLIGSGATASGTMMLTLPAAAVPFKMEHIAAGHNEIPASDQGSGFGIDNGVNNGGTAALTALAGPTGWQSLQATYMPASYPSNATATGCTTAWCPLTLTTTANGGGGWSYYGSSWSPPRYTKTADGIVLVKGLIGNGQNLAQDIPIANLPAGFCPKQRLLMTVLFNHRWARVDVTPGTGGGCTINQEEGIAATPWLSLDSIAFRAEW